MISESLLGGASRRYADSSRELAPRGEGFMHGSCMGDERTDPRVRELAAMAGRRGLRLVPAAALLLQPVEPELQGEDVDAGTGPAELDG